MMRSLIFIFVLCLCAIEASAQSKKQDNGSLGGRTFVYGQDVKLPHPIKIDHNDSRKLSEILEDELKDTGITYRITKTHILLFAPKKDIKEVEPIKTHTLYGYVIDNDSKESLIGANIYVPIRMTGTSTNDYGYFSITLPEGEMLVETSYVGYMLDSRIINLTSDTLITVTLKQNQSLSEVIVDSDRPETGVSSSRSGAVSMPVQQIMRMPALLGEPDVIKALQFQPGVQSTMSGQASISVRGGDSDQNLFLLDGMMLYNVDHIMGFESAFMPDAVKHVDFFRGSFPARYGGRLSSITDVRTKDGDMQSYHGTLSIGLLSSHLSLEGPIKKDRTSFIVSARRTYADLLINAFKKPLGLDVDYLGLYFYDLNAKINHKISDSDRLYLSFYSGRDVTNVKDKYKSEYESNRNIDKTTEDMRWGNTLYHLRWNHIFSPKLFANTTIGYNRFTLSSLAEYENKEYRGDNMTNSLLSSLLFKSGIDDFSSNIDFDYHPVPEHHMRFGAQYTLHKFRPEIQSSRILNIHEGSPESNETFSSYNKYIFANETAIYAEDDMNLGKHWQLNAGFRAAIFSTQGKVYPTLEPRLSASRVFESGIRAKAAYTMMHQYVHKITSSQIASPSDLWVPVTKNMKPMSAHQWSVGAGYDQIQGWEFGSDIYWKEMYNVVDIIDGASFLGNSKGWESKVTSGRGRSYGIELFANKTLGKTTGSINYTLSKSDRWFADGLINSGRAFPYRYDRRHVVHFMLQHQLTDCIDLNAAWNFSSGALVTVAKQQTEYIEPGNINLPGDYFSSRNNYRMEPTHQLDLGINIHKQKKHGERIWNFSLMNAYSHLNQDMVFSTIKTEDKVVGVEPDGRPIVERKERSVLKQITVIPVLPSFSYTYKF